MAHQLKFSGIQPVNFNGRDCAPKQLNTGARIRLQRITFTSEADIEEANEILASCFEDGDKDYVLNFLEKQMTPTDKSILKSYLLDGEKAIAMLDHASEAMAEKAVSEMTRKIEVKEAGNE